MTRLTLRERVLGRTEDRSLPPAENQLPLTYHASPIAPLAALKIADVWAAVRVLADSISSLPLHVYRKQGDGREKVTSGFLTDLLERPGPGVTQADLVSTLMVHLATWGNGYLAKYRQAGQVVQLGLLDPDRVRPELEGGRLRFRYSPGSGAQQMLTTSDVVHVKGLSTDTLVGLSAVSQASRVIGLSDELVKHAMSYFETGGSPPVGVLRVSDISDEGRTRLEERIKADARSHGILLLEGDAEYDPVAQKLDNAQFAQQREIAAREVARCFRIPPHMIGAQTGDSLTYSTVEQESINFVRYSLTPWLRRIELAISGDRDLTFQRQFVRFEVDGLLRADARTRSEVYARALDPITGWMSRPEVRRLEDLPEEREPPGIVPVQQVVASSSANGEPVVTGAAGG